MSHAIAVWRLVMNRASSFLPLAPGAAGDDFPDHADGDEPVAEINRRYPGLSRELAEYLAR